MGGHRKLNFIEQDDAKEFEKYLLRTKEKNQNFFYELNLKVDHSIKNAFWANARSMAAYEYFEDVISFDMTYKTNKYNLAFGSFVGVNHHEYEELTGILPRAFDKIMAKMQEYQAKSKVEPFRWWINNPVKL
ncbi:protein FAR1-RELATED SEQUENCE 4-like [Arachis duranensis]|uniref:Protein FAR1-RELATED SEQUENCE 4-like n=1 Tax=Arachis duranensis TaxID=130453 RepID=A0A6P4BH05_ARADU|nr:protein FAR1-RELATED SEQUENCE 4-like [Arachis duranensis]